MFIAGLKYMRRDGLSMVAVRMWNRFGEAPVLGSPASRRTRKEDSCPHSRRAIASGGHGSKKGFVGLADDRPGGSLHYK